VASRRNALRRKDSGDNGRQAAESPWKESWVDELFAVVCFAGAVFLLASFLSQLSHCDWVIGPDGCRPGNIMGPWGQKIGAALSLYLGWCSLVPVVCLVWLSVFLWRIDEGSGTGFSWRSEIGTVGMLIFSCLLGTVLFGEFIGGKLGKVLAFPLVNAVDRGGAGLLGGAALLLCLSYVTQSSVLQLVKGAAVTLVWIAAIMVQLPLSLMRFFWRAASQWVTRRRESRESRRPLPLPPARVRKNKLPEPEPVIEAAEDEEADEDDEDEVEETPTHVVVSRRNALKRKTEKKSSLEEKKAANGFPPYRLPSREFLKPGETTPGAEDDAELLEKSRMIESKLRDFGVLGKVTQVHPGPVITLFEFEPAAGVKVGRVSALSDDLSMSLRASAIRVIAPIPKRGTVGIEIPNRHRDIVRLRDVLDSEAFTTSRSVLSVCLGKDTVGEPVVVDIASMPHLLMAGATGTGKSVSINSLLLSLLYRASPAEVGLILIDPKMIELSIYEGIPHLRVPVVINPRQARAVLQWAVDEMHRRYRLIQRFEVRNIDGYNRIVRGEVDKDGKDKEEGTRLKDNVVMLQEDAIVAEGTIDKEADHSQAIAAEKLEPLPKIVIVIDEVADLMLSVGREIEELITRLAQKARAAGIHLIIATQRPSVDVITGLIKANFPTRLSFRVTSRVDSRTILDSMGAEKLLGDGDMLVLQPGGAALKRVHGAYVSDTEVKKVISAVKNQCKPQYDDRIMRIVEQALEEESASSAGGGDLGEDRYDPVYDKAVELVVQKGQASTSMIQRVFNIGYNRAARIIELMEKEGIVGPMNGSNRREVLLPPAQE
jgi:S-DNA-T family DNA segregation ATPase FtsK/SpoIIIE